jgi:hypothetical protein
MRIFAQALSNDALQQISDILIFVVSPSLINNFSLHNPTGLGWTFITCNANINNEFF